MTSLSEVYEGGMGTVVGRRQRILGMGLFALGTAMVVAAIPLATTDVGALFALSVYESRLVAGVLAGLGLPAAFVGIFTVLPANAPTRALAAIGSALSIFGVMLFAYAYPSQWVSNEPVLALLTTLVYVVGVLLTFWCLFVGVATFKTRNDPGGTARVELTEEGRIKIVDAGRSVPKLGGVGLFGSEPDGDVPTQTGNQADDDILTSSGPSGSAGEGLQEEATTSSEMLVPEPSSDGGAAAADDPAVEDSVVEAARTRGRPDEYCGNCAHFQYVRADGELSPFCGLHRDLLEDMDACEQWESNSDSTTSPR